jgi:hypothetical protein
MGERDSRCSLIKRVRDKGKVFFFKVSSFLRFLLMSEILTVCWMCRGKWGSFHDFDLR